MILVRNLRLAPREGLEKLPVLAARKLRIYPEQIKSCSLVKKSLDARKKDDIHYVCAVALELEGEERLLKKLKAADVSQYTPVQYNIEGISRPERPPVVVGFGPAGMFAALVLAKAGARPIVLERGRDAVSRKAAVERFRSEGILDTDCNVQFGEGGAGTFSDGKLNTGTKDPRISWVLRQFAEHGAPENIVYDAKPHIGTDILVDVVQNIRRSIIELGGEVRFEHRLEELELCDGRLTGLRVSSPRGTYSLPCSELILALGHSARDTVRTLFSQGLRMERKAFSMGVRIEHLQKDIDLAQYGRAREELPAADYSLSVHLADGGSAYTFCMCPGGEVMAAASEEGGLVTNGMSYSQRDGDNANSALLVTLHPEDFPGEGVLAGMEWQRQIEKAAYNYGGGNYMAPAQLVKDFITGRPSTGPGRVKPSYKPGVIWGDIHEVLPALITDVLEKALPQLGKKLRGFDDGEAVLTAPETRSSSPVRMPRNEGLVSNIGGVYPCGEGAGYAGGITSAAVDGMRCAEAVLKNCR